MMISNFDQEKDAFRAEQLRIIKEAHPLPRFWQRLLFGARWTEIEIENHFSVLTALWGEWAFEDEIEKEVMAKAAAMERAEATPGELE